MGKYSWSSLPVLSLLYLNILSYICIIWIIRKKAYSFKSMLFHKQFIFKRKSMVSEVQTLYLNFFIKHKNIHHPTEVKSYRRTTVSWSIFFREWILRVTDTTGRQRDGLIYEIWLHNNIVIINNNNCLILFLYNN